MAARKRAATKATKTRGAKNLVIVESGAKAATLQRFLGSRYKVVASVGHVRDLPANAAQVPKDYKGKPWANLAVDVDQGFRPVYVIPANRKKIVANLRSELKTAQELLIATDEDREGEAIAWHLVEVLKPRQPIRRMVFHEITRSAVEEALGRTRDIDEHLVRAQEARRVLDRLIGYLVSPVLWKKVQSGLSAGRVQTPALRLIVDRERERMKFVIASYWRLTATLAPADRPEESFEARLVSLDGQAIATGEDFAATGDLLADRSARRLDAADARGVATALADATFHVVAVEKRRVTRRPPPPFITSTLQQAASGRLRFSARQTMRVAQQLYESGYITYMRTDSPTLSEQALAAARSEVRRLVGEEYLPERPRRYRARAARAQEAHEAIRPAGEQFRHPDDLGDDVNAEGRRLYTLIWQRTLASQMRDAILERTRVQDRGGHGGRRNRRVSSQRPGRAVRRIHAGLRRRRRRPHPAGPDGRRSGCKRSRHRADRARNPTARPLDGGQPDPRIGAAGHRSPVHLRHYSRDDSRQICGAQGLGAGSPLARVRRDPANGHALPRVGRRRLHRPHGRRSRQGRRRASSIRCPGCPRSTLVRTARRPTARRPCCATASTTASTPAGTPSTRAPFARSPWPEPTARRRRCALAATARTSKRRRATGERGCRKTWSPIN